MCRMSISVCPPGMLSTDKHSTATLSVGTAVFIGGQRWTACRNGDDAKAPNLHTSISCVGERQLKAKLNSRVYIYMADLQNLLQAKQIFVPTQDTI